jgi:hypothetical protein
LTEESAKAIFERIWRQFSVDRKEGRASASAKLQRALAEHAGDLVPAYATAKELMTMIFDCEQFSKGDRESNNDDPLTNMSDWLSGKTDLSRISMVKERTH